MLFLCLDFCAFVMTLLLDTQFDQPGVNQYTGEPEGDDASNEHDLIGQGQDQNGIVNQDKDQDKDQDCPIGEEDNLPEERFHRADVVSQHMIDTREKQRQEKVSTKKAEGDRRPSLIILYGVRLYIHVYILRRIHVCFLCSLPFFLVSCSLLLFDFHPKTVITRCYVIEADRWLRRRVDPLLMRPLGVGFSLPPLHVWVVHYLGLLLSLRCTFDLKMDISSGSLPNASQGYH